ncbi:M14 family zinc carboxypeptidase [Pelistega sp. MC2]|uniref:M14 family zinc carboxypeptidase n=1 Tax=Pelistega sp. MC2 TaxID=1720297 RepID=UPI0008DABDB1|nr:M14 family zinc carboxypeptidase [Pelistega sp. MC2]
MKEIFSKKYQDIFPENSKTLWLFAPLSIRSKLKVALEKMINEGEETGHFIEVKSAYKTLLCEIREKNLLKNCQDVLIRYPVVEGDEPLRFRLETYPLESLYPHCKILYEPFPQEADQGVYYEVVLDGIKTEKVFVPVKWKDKLNGKRELNACGWIEYIDGTSTSFYTAYEAMYDEACQYLMQLPLSLKECNPHQIVYDMSLEGEDEPLGIGHESLSLAEAMHEDVYFSALEIFQHRLGLISGDRTLRPGQVLPNVYYGKENELTILSGQWAATREIGMDECNTDLASVECSLSEEKIFSYLDRLGGGRFEATSLQGRPLKGTVIKGVSNVEIALSAGQHANESSGIVGALRAAKTLVDNGEVSFTLRPLGNPDGYAAFRKLSEQSPNYMHHAARYTAAGCDLAYGDVPENAFTKKALTELPNALVHLNLHGYPAHEWTRPLSGYVPRNFSRWTIPKGFFLILRYKPGFKDLAEKVLDVSIKALMDYTEQAQQNQQMIKQYLATVGSADFPIAYQTIPYSIDEYTNQDYPVELITEAPDETVQGEWFRIAHESHYRVVMAVVEALKDIQVRV